MANFEEIFCIDGSGNKKQRDANLKRPIYCVSTRKRSISRFELNGQSALSIFTEHCESASMDNRILIAADVAIGLPVKPELLWSCQHTFQVGWRRHMRESATGIGVMCCLLTTSHRVQISGHL